MPVNDIALGLMWQSIPIGDSLWQLVKLLVFRSKCTRLGPGQIQNTKSKTNREVRNPKYEYGNTKQTKTQIRNPHTEILNKFTWPKSQSSKTVLYFGPLFCFYCFELRISCFELEFVWPAAGSKSKAWMHGGSFLWNTSLDWNKQFTSIWDLSQRSTSALTYELASFTSDW